MLWKGRRQSEQHRGRPAARAAAAFRVALAAAAVAARRAFRSVARSGGIISISTIIILVGLVLRVVRLRY